MINWHKLPEAPKIRIVLGEGTVIVKNFGIDNDGLFLYNEGKNVELKLPLDANKRRYRLVIEEIE